MPRFTPPLRPLFLLPLSLAKATMALFLLNLAYLTAFLLCTSRLALRFASRLRRARPLPPPPPPLLLTPSHPPRNPCASPPASPAPAPFPAPAPPSSSPAPPPHPFPPPAPSRAKAMSSSSPT